MSEINENLNLEVTDPVTQNLDLEAEEAQDVPAIILNLDMQDGASVKSAEAWAVGQRGGVDVPSTDVTYHNNAKYYSEETAAAIDDIVVVQDATPTAQKTKVWMPATAPSGVQVPTYAEHQAVEATLAKVTPTNTGTQGQILRNNGQGGAVWTDAATAEEVATAAEAWLNDHVSQGETLAIDNTLTLSGYAGDAKVTGDKISELKSALDGIAEAGIKKNIDVSSWTKGSINTSSGAAGTSNTRIRTDQKDNEFVGVSAETGYKYMVYAYEGSTYKGIFNGSTIEKSAYWLTGFTNMFAVPKNYKLRFLVAESVESSSIATTDSSNFYVYTSTDKGLTLNGIAADAKAVGDKLATIKEKIGGESENLHDANTDTVGAYWNDNYEEVTETGTTYYRHTALIDISGYDYISWTGGSSASLGVRCWFVSEDNAGIADFGMRSSGELNIPDGTKYVTFSAGKNNTSLAIFGGTNGNIANGFVVVDKEIENVKKSGGKWPFEGEWGFGQVKSSNGGIDDSYTYCAAVHIEDLTLPKDTEIVADPYWCLRFSYLDDNNTRRIVSNDVSVWLLEHNAHDIRISVKKVDADTTETAVIDTWKTHVHWYGGTSEFERIKGESFSIAMFTTWGVVGDSYGEGGHNRSWGSILAGMLGNADGFTNFSKSGISTSTYIGSQYGLLKLLAAEPKEFYWLQLGINDAAKVKNNPAYLGSIADISGSYEDYPDTFYGNYGHIMEAIKAHSPDAAFIMATALFGSISGTVSSTASTNLPPVNAAIKEIAEHYGIPCIEILDDPFIYSQLYIRMMGSSGSGNHPVVAAYSAVARAYERLFSKCVVDNYTYFRSISFG